MTETQEKILKGFMLDSKAVACESYGCGHINVTFLVRTESGKHYILQKINDRTFPDVEGLMENIRLVTEHIRKKSEDTRSVLTFVPTIYGGNWVHTESGYWRVYEFVEDSLCLQMPETPEDFYESAMGFGKFQQQLADFPAEKLVEVIPNFHNTPDRYRIFREALARDAAGRASSVKREAEFYLARENEMATLQIMRENGELPLRVTHNDTKLNNVLLDAKTRKALCVIDLDTVMPGLSLYDFGDAIRYGASTAAEDERDLGKVAVDIDLFRTFTRGFLKSCPGLTERETAMLPMGAKTMTLECGLRFLTDYLDGDRYFAARYEGQNLDRARVHMKLVQDMEAKWDKMAAIVREESVCPLMMT